MLRLVVCDCDGTLLLENEDRLRNDVIDMITKITDRKIMFVVASGRCYQDLKRLFSGVLGRTVFICNDGAVSVYQNSIIDSNTICRSVLAEVAKKFGHVYLYGVNNTYCIGKDIMPVINESRQVDNLNCVGSGIHKIGFYGIDSRLLLSELSMLGLRMSYKSRNWCEFVMDSVDKGVAVSSVMQKFKINYEESACFGDGINDLPMFDRCKETYAISGSYAAASGKALFQCDDIVGTILNLLKIK
ncbi:MAG: HAD family hydrolase [bacterium]|nr:HAD family hydrolase [bacterium]